MKRKDTAFTLENTRTQLAKDKDFVKLRSTYSDKFPEIADKNTSAMWSELNHAQISKKGNPMAWQRVHICADLIKHKKDILDVGFGSGIIERLIVKSNPSIHISGIDIAKESVKEIKKIIPHGNFQVGSILKLPYKKMQFDCVLALEVMEHIQPHLTFIALGEIFRVIKKKGMFVVSVPLNEGLELLDKENRNLNAHVRVYTPVLIKSELHIAGFTVLSEKYLYAFHTFPIIKIFFAKIFSKKFHPNNIIIVCQKK